MYDNEFLEKTEEKIKKMLKKKRFRHTIGVAHTAACLAMCYGEDCRRAYLAGLLHDVAKSLSDEEMLKESEKYGIPIRPFDRQCPSMLHGALGAQIAKHEFGIKDEGILDAIANHTVGRVGMSLLEEIVFTADYIENGRFKPPGLSEVRALAFKDLKACISLILTNTLEYVKSTGEELDEKIFEVIDHYKKA